jgi:putative glycosyltransferase (TIGR04372 family)
MNFSIYKIINILKFIFGFLPALTIFLLLRIKFKKIALVSLFSSKFGHFYINTEYFLRKNNNEYFNIYYTEQIVDNIYLLRAWKKKIFIVPYFIGFSLFKFRNILKLKIFNCRNFSAIDRKSFLSKKILTKKINRDQFFFTCSIRNNYYQKKNQLQSDEYQNFRDTNIKDFNNIILQFINETNEMNGVLINSNGKKLIQNKSISNKKFSYNNSNNFDDLLSLISKSSFHFGSSTGVDTLAFAHNIPTALFNTIFGSSFNFINYPSKCIISPTIMMYKKSQKIIGLKRNIEILKFMEKKFKKDRLDFKDQENLNIVYKKSTKDEMYNLLKEIYLYSRDLLKLSIKQKKLQNKFWSIYPDIQKEVLTKKIVSDQKIFKPLISPYYLKKYEKVLF